MHTPTPWEQRAETDGRHIIHYIKIGTSNAYMQRGVGMTEKETRANAAFIVRACNSHAELLAAAKDVLAAYHGLTLGRQDTEWEGQLNVALRQAIAKAESGLDTH